MTDRPTDILLVEDDPMTRLIMRSLLQESDYRVREAEMGRDALEMIADDSPDLVVLDYYLPDMTGADVISELSAMELSLPIVVVTGYDDPKLVEKVMALGASRFLHKDSECHYLRLLPSIIAEMLGSTAAATD